METEQLLSLISHAIERKAFLDFDHVSSDRMTITKFDDNCSVIANKNKQFKVKNVGLKCIYKKISYYCFDVKFIDLFEHIHKYCKDNTLLVFK